MDADVLAPAARDTLGGGKLTGAEISQSAAGVSGRDALEQLHPGAATVARSMGDALVRTRAFVSARWRLCVTVTLGAAAAGAVGYLVSQNPHAEPAHIAVSLRVAIIDALIFAGAYARTNTGQSRMGGLLVAAGLYACLWLLNGSSDGAVFTVGRLAAALAPTVFCFLLLAYPTGRLRSSTERRFLLVGGGLLMAASTLLILTSVQPSFRTPLVNCAPQCPRNPAYAGSIDSGLIEVAKAVGWLTWIVIACGTLLVLLRRSRNSVKPLRRSAVPVEAAALANAVFSLAWAVSRLTGSTSASAVGAAYVEVALAIPVLILAGLFVERLSMGRALTTFINRLTERPNVDPEAILSEALSDPSLKIAYYRPEIGAHTDSAGRRVAVPEADAERAVVQIERDNGEVAAVSFDPSLVDQAAFVEAAGAVAAMHVEATHLEADLIASNKELAASRLRLMEAADTERQRIERDLHDGVQQYILGLRLRLDLAAEAIREDPRRGERMIGAIGRQVDELLVALRSFAAGIYPSVLTDYGLRDALGSLARTIPTEVSVQTFRIGRYSEDVEVAVYFCCAEAIQNVVKHAGPGASTHVRLWHVANALSFDVRDSGRGFDPAASSPGHGLINMRDRIEAVGGALWVTSRRSWGTSVQGRVPLS